MELSQTHSIPFPYVLHFHFPLSLHSYDPMQFNVFIHSVTTIYATIRYAAYGNVWLAYSVVKLSYYHTLVHSAIMQFQHCFNLKSIK